MDDVQFYQAPAGNDGATPQREVTTHVFSTPLSYQSSTPNAALFTNPTPFREASQSTITSTIEYSQSHEASQLNLRSNARGRSLNEDEVLILFNCALEIQDEYNGGKKSFWEALEARFVIEAGHTYSWKSCKAKIEARVRQRKAYITKYETGRETEATSPLDIAIDEWVEFLEEYQEEEKEESSQRTQDVLFQQQQVLYRDGLLATMDKATKRRAQSHQSANNDESSNPEDDSNDDTALVRGSSKGAKRKKRKVQIQPTFEDILAMHKDSIKQERRLIKSLIKPSVSTNQDALSEEIKKIGARVDKLEGDINQKFDMILQHLEKGRRK